jgi:hypothetical protein
MAGGCVEADCASGASKARTMSANAHAEPKMLRLAMLVSLAAKANCFDFGKTMMMPISLAGV